jgi:predicted oxidoreductase (fatty acid repression mutant protein)
MKIIEKYSHLNGLEYLLVHNPKLWDEIQNVVEAVDAEKCKTKISKEKRMIGKLLYSPDDMNKMFKEQLSKYNGEKAGSVIG